MLPLRLTDMLKVSPMVLTRECSYNSA